jgi:uncharacterized protein
VNDEKLIIFTRFPEPGCCKTRLIPALGAAGAADLHRRMTAHTLVEAGQLRRQRATAVEVRFTGGSASQMRAVFGEEFLYVDQGAGDLGTRLRAATEQALRDGHRAVVLIGTDCPALSFHDLAEAFAQLVNHDAVIGPATDGGYYLLGVREADPALFTGIDWSTERVFDQTIGAMNRMGWRVQMLRRLQDVDNPADLP